MNKAAFLRLCIQRTGTQHCSCLRLYDVAQSLNRLSEKQIEEVVALTVATTVEEFVDNGWSPVLRDMCLHDGRFKRGLQKFHVLQLRKKA